MIDVFFPSGGARRHRIVDLATPFENDAFAGREAIKVRTDIVPEGWDGGDVYVSLHFSIMVHFVARLQRRGDSLVFVELGEVEPPSLANKVLRIDETIPVEHPLTLPASLDLETLAARLRDHVVQVEGPAQEDPLFLVADAEMESPVTYGAGLDDAGFRAMVEAILSLHAKDPADTPYCVIVGVQEPACDRPDVEIVHNVTAIGQIALFFLAECAPPIGYIWEYNDGARCMVSGYVRCAPTLDISTEPLSALERARKAVSLRDAIAALAPDPDRAWAKEALLRLHEPEPSGRFRGEPAFVLPIRPFDVEGVVWCVVTLSGSILRHDDEASAMAALDDPR